MTNPTRKPADQMKSPRKKVSLEAEQSERGVAVVTGGAGSMGTMICGALAREGMRVVIGYNRSAEKAKTLAASLPGERTRGAGGAGDGQRGAWRIRRGN